jgi:hypothetical protein
MLHVLGGFREQESLAQSRPGGALRGREAGSALRDGCEVGQGFRMLPLIGIEVRQQCSDASGGQERLAQIGPRGPLEGRK